MDNLRVRDDNYLYTWNGKCISGIGDHQKYSGLLCKHRRGALKAIVIIQISEGQAWSV